MRSAIACQTMLFKSLNTRGGVATCRNCEQLCEGRLIHVDHHRVPFKHILEEFCKLHAVDLALIEVRDGVLVDAELMSKWQNHHAEKATYQILCMRCNTSKGCKVVENVLVL